MASEKKSEPKIQRVRFIAPCPVGKAEEMTASIGIDSAYIPGYQPTLEFDVDPRFIRIVTKGVVELVPLSNIASIRLQS